jgi:RNA polymerase sigma factor (sigma-70 family)
VNAWVERLRDRWLRWAQRKGVPAEEAEDLVQNAACAVFSVRRPPFKTEKDFYWYFIRTMNRRMGNGKRQVPSMPLEMIDGEEDPAPGPEECLLRKEEHLQRVAAVECLRPQLKRLIYDRAADLSWTEIAAKNGIGVAAARQRGSSASREVRRSLAGPED